jgi:UDP-N-acetyl-D-mannosaminuronic acid dehydrogenase
MGLAFKPNIDDLRESPAKYIVNKVLQNDNNGEYFIVEPNLEEHNVFKLTNYIVAMEKADIIVFLVAHRQFQNVNLSEEKVILDFCGIEK